MSFARLDDNAQAVGLTLSGNRKTVHALVICAAFLQFCASGSIVHHHLSLLDLVAAVKAAFRNNLIPFCPCKNIDPVGLSRMGQCQREEQKKCGQQCGQYG